MLTIKMGFNTIYSGHVDWRTFFGLKRCQIVATALINSSFGNFVIDFFIMPLTKAET